MKIKMIAAVDLNYGIGKDGKLLFKIPEDMKKFKEFTSDNIVLMGRKTYESIGSKPLHDRINIVISSSKTYEGIMTFTDLPPAIEHCKSNYPEKDLYIIGGGQIYSQGLKHADEIIITVYNKEYEADTYFPHTNLGEQFISTEFFMEGSYEGVEFKSFVGYRYD